jgi:hypothetical protein
MIVNVGIQGIVNLLASGTWEIAVGTGTNSPMADNLTLQTEYDRKDATVTAETTTIAGDTLQFYAEFVWGEDVTLTEFGVFEKTVGWMLLREIVPLVDVPVGETLPVTIQVPLKRV